jgi:hypothetical protein
MTMASYVVTPERWGAKTLSLLNAATILSAESELKRLNRLPDTYHAVIAAVAHRIVMPATHTGLNGQSAW